MSPPGRPQVVVLDYGSGNLRSAQRALQRAGADVTVTADAAAALSCDGLVVPGVGAFAACMTGLRAIRGEAIIGKRLAAGRPVLGICVGMQALFAEGVEHGQRTAGCGVLPGVVERLDAPVLPHMGWNTVRPPPAPGCWPGSTRKPGSTSCTPMRPGRCRRAPAPRPRPPGGQPLLTLATHGQDFIAAIEDGPLCATQFHPEKSADAGAALLANWLESLR